MCSCDQQWMQIWVVCQGRTNSNHFNAALISEWTEFKLLKHLDTCIVWEFFIWLGICYTDILNIEMHTRPSPNQRINIEMDRLLHSDILCRLHGVFRYMVVQLKYKNFHPSLLKSPWQYGTENLDVCWKASPRGHHSLHW